MNTFESLDNWVILIVASIILVLSLIIYFAYVLKYEFLDNAENNVLVRTGGNAGSYVTNLQEFTQPGQGQQDFSNVAYQTAWMGDMTRRPVVEHLVDNRCSANAGNQDFLDQHLNIRNPDGSTVYDTLSAGELYAGGMKGTEVKMAEMDSKAKYERCMKYNTDPNLCAPGVNQFVVDNLRGIAYYG